MTDRPANPAAAARAGEAEPEPCTVCGVQYGPCITGAHEYAAAKAERERITKWVRDHSEDASDIEKGEHHQ